MMWGMREGRQARGGRGGMGGEREGRRRWWEGGMRLLQQLLRGSARGCGWYSCGWTVLTDSLMTDFFVTVTFL
jgi:hypothetical protein